jgi:hypothetical protein
MVPIILNLERIVNGGTFDNLTSIIIHSFVVFGDNTNKVVCFRANGVTIFQGLKTGVIVQLVNKHYPSVVEIHYMAHWCNLIVQT